MRGLDEPVPGLACDLRGDQHRQVRPVRQQPGQRKPQIGLDPPQQRRPGVRGGTPVRPVIKVPVSDQQPVLLQPPVELAGQDLLPGALARHPADLRADHGVGAALADRDHPDLRERRAVRVPRALTRVAERGGVLRRVRGVPLKAVDRHQPPARQERAPGQQLRHRHSHLAEQPPQRLIPQPLPGLGNPSGGRHAPRRVPAPPPRQRAGQPRRDLLIVIIGEQRHRHREIHHHVRRQLAIPPPGLPPGRRDRVIDRVPRNRGGQHPKRDLVRQPSPRHCLP